VKRLGLILALLVGAYLVSPADAQGRFWVLVNGSLKYTGTITVTGRATVDSVTAAAGGDYTFVGRSNLMAPAAGVLLLANSQNSVGLRMQFGNSPTIGSGFGGSPSVVSGSSDSAFSVNVGTGGAATSGVVNFATTWAVAPVCIAQDQTTVGAGAQKVATTTAAATITTAVAWTANDIVNVLCFGARV